MERDRDAAVRRFFSKLRHPYGKTMVKNSTVFLTAAPVGVLRDTLNFVDSRYGSALRYLDVIGFDAGWRAKLKGALLEDVPEKDVKRLADLAVASAADGGAGAESGGGATAA